MPPMQIQHELYMRVLNYCLQKKLGYTDEQGIQHSLIPGECKKTEYHFIFDEPENRKLECSLNESVFKWISTEVNKMFLSAEGVKLPNYQKSEDKAKIHCKYCSYADICSSADMGFQAF